MSKRVRITSRVFTETFSNSKTKMPKMFPTFLFKNNIWAFFETVDGKNIIKTRTSLRRESLKTKFSRRNVKPEPEIIIIISLCTTAAATNVFDNRTRPREYLYNARARTLYIRIYVLCTCCCGGFWRARERTIPGNAGAGRPSLKSFWYLFYAFARGLRYSLGARGGR